MLTIDGSTHGRHALVRGCLSKTEHATAEGGERGCTVHVSGYLHIHLEQERNDSLALLWVIREASMVPFVPLVRPRGHQPELVEEEQPRRRHRRDERSDRRKVWRWRCSEREPEPLHPLAEVVRVRDEPVKAAMRDRIVLSGRLLVLSVVILFVGHRSLAPCLVLAAEVEEDLVVVNVPSKAGSPEADADPEARAAKGASEEPLRGGRGEVRAEEGAVKRVEQDGGERNHQVRLRSRGCAKRRYDSAVEVVHQKKGREEGWGVRERQRRRVACCLRGQGRLEIRVDEGKERDELHEYP